MPDLINAIYDKLIQVEMQNLEVGIIILNPREIAKLTHLSQHADIVPFDLNANSKLSNIFSFGYLMGFLWGAFVVQSFVVPEGHIIVVPDGINISSIDSILFTKHLDLNTLHFDKSKFVLHILHLNIKNPKSFGHIYNLYIHYYLLLFL